MTKIDRLPVPPPKGALVSINDARNGSHSNVADAVRLPPGTTIDGIDCSGMIDDPKKAGVPPYLQVQNRKGLTPEQFAKVKAIQTAARAEEKAKLRERAEMAKQLGMAPTEMRKHGAKLKSETKSKEATVKRKTSKNAKTPKPASAAGQSKTEIALKLLKRERGATRKEIADAANWPSIDIKAIAKRHGLKLTKKDDAYLAH